MSKFDENLACIGTSLRNARNSQDPTNMSADVSKVVGGATGPRDAGLSPLLNQKKRLVQKHLTSSIH